MLSPIAARHARDLQDRLDAGTLPFVRSDLVLAGELAAVEGSLELVVRIVLADAEHLAHLERTRHLDDAHYRAHWPHVEAQLAALWLVVARYSVVPPA